MASRKPIVRVGGKLQQLPDADKLPLGVVDGAVGTGDSRLSDAREWTADTVGQAEAEAGTATTRRAWTAQRVFQAIAAWWNASAAKSKLDGIATGATANATDAHLLARANHTGSQAASTISDFSSAVAATDSVTANTAKVTNATHTGDVTGATALTIANGAVTLAKQANMATASVVYRKTAGAGAPEVQTLATLKTDLGLTGTNSGDQTSIVGITGTKAQFNTAVSDGSIQFVGDAPTSHSHTLADITDAGNVAAINTNASTANYLRGDGTWVTPPNTTYSLITEAAITTGTETTARTISAARLKYAFDNLTAANAAVAATCSGNAATATKLAAARTIGMTGDGTWSVSFDGSGNVTASMTLANSGVTAGTYNDSATQVRPFTVDAKGRITGIGTAVTITPAWGSISSKPTTIGGYGITDLGSYAPTLTGTGASGTWGIAITGNAATATKLATTRALTIGSTAKNFDGSAAVSWSLAEIGAQATLVSGTNIKTINSESLLGSGNIAISGGGGGSGCQIFTSSGTFTVPAGVTKVKATVIGGGAAGAQAGSTSTTGGGGAGGMSIGVFTVTPESGITVTVGAGGDAGNGGTSSFGAHCSATGGVRPATNGSTGGAGGVGSGGDINVTGGAGSDSTSDYTYNGSSWLVNYVVGSGGGSSGQEGAVGFNAFTGSTGGEYSNGAVPSVGGAGAFGGAGAGSAGYTDNTNGNNATGYGNGGSGVRRTGGTRYGGLGSPGVVIVEW